MGIASRAPGHVSYFTVGPDDAVWTKAWTASGGWTDWTSLGGTATSAPRAIGWANGRIDVFVRGSDGSAWQKTYWPSSGWTATWNPLGGSLDSSIEAASPNPNRLDVFGRDTSGRFSFRTWTSDAGWYPWTQSGRDIFSGVGAVWWRPDGVNDRLDVFTSGTGHPLYQGVWTVPFTDASWSWYQLDGQLDSDPDVASPNNSRLDVVARGTDGNTYLKTWLAGATGWTGWQGLGGPSIGSPQAVWWNDGSQQRLDVANLSVNDSVESRTWTGSAGWGVWTDLGTPQLPDGTLVREQSSPTVYWADDGAIYPISSAAVADQAGLDLSTTLVVSDGSLAGIPVGTTITSDALSEGGVEPDPGTAEAAGSSWKFHHQDDISVTSGDGRAGAAASLKWYQGKFPYAFRHRGNFTPESIVVAFHPVGCMWVKVRWGYPLASISLPPGASISGAQEDQGYFVKCKASGAPSPTSMSLAGLGYAKGFLNSATLTVCVSDTRTEGPRYCSNNKQTFP